MTPNSPEWWCLSVYVGILPAIRLGILLSLLVFAPLSCFKRTRLWSARWLVTMRYAFLITTRLLSAGVIFASFGWIALPVTILAWFLMPGFWTVFVLVATYACLAIIKIYALGGALLIMLVMAIFCQILAARAFYKISNETVRPAPMEHSIE